MAYHPPPPTLPFNTLPGLTRHTDGQGTRPCPIRLAHLTGHALQEVPKFTIEDVCGVVGGGTIEEEMGTRKECDRTGSYGRMVVVTGLKKCSKYILYIQLTMCAKVVHNMSTQLSHTPGIQEGRMLSSNSAHIPQQYVFCVPLLHTYVARQCN